jgi:hypothetical protein
MSLVIDWSMPHVEKKTLKMIHDSLREKGRQLLVQVSGWYRVLPLSTVVETVLGCFWQGKNAQSDEK